MSAASAPGSSSGCAGASTPATSERAARRALAETAGRTRGGHGLYGALIGFIGGHVACKRDSSRDRGLRDEAGGVTGGPYDGSRAEASRLSVPKGSTTLKVTWERRPTRIRRHRSVSVLERRSSVQSGPVKSSSSMIK